MLFKLAIAPASALVLTLCSIEGGKASELDKPSMLYEAIAHAETGGELNPWTRTRFKPKGKISTAFGPVQITGLLYHHYFTVKQHLFTLEEQNALLVLLQQAHAFKICDYQTEPLKLCEGYTYGGYGIGMMPDGQAMYKQIAVKMMDHHLRVAAGDMLEAARMWRFGFNSDELPAVDKRYFKDFCYKLEKLGGECGEF